LEKISKAKIAANNRYTAKAYDRLYPFVPRGRKAEIQAAADAQGETLNEFIVKAIDERMKRVQKAEPFIPPPGEFCTKDCKKRSLQIRGQYTSHEDMISAGVPWCSLYMAELEWKDKETGICFKCEKCLNECRKKEQEKN